jgi:glycosyltransferase involved in cell wall biosynthesis
MTKCPQTIYSIATKIGGAGLGITSYNAVKALSDAGYLKKAVCYGNKSDIDREKVLALPGNPAKLLFFLPRNYYRPLRKGFLDFVTSRLILKEGCDVFHGWNNQALKSIRAAKRIGAKAIIDSGSIHRFAKDEILDEEYRRFGVRVNKYPEYARKSSLEELSLADYIFLNSEFAKSTFIEAGFDEKKIFLLGRGADVARFSPGEKKDNVFRVLFAGRIGIRKGVQYLLEAWKGLNLKDAELVLIGNIDDNFKPVISRYSGLDNVVFTGFLKNPEEVFRKASIFVFPSLEEGGAKVTYESMAAGLPLVTTINSGSIVRDGEDGYIIPIRDAAAIREKILYLYENPGEIKRLGANGRLAVMGYTWQRYRDNVIDAYRALLSR